MLSKKVVFNREGWNSFTGVHLSLKLSSVTSAMSKTISLIGTIYGHGDWSTSIATMKKYHNLVLSSSRNKYVLVWTLMQLAVGSALG